MRAKSPAERYYQPGPEKRGPGDDYVRPEELQEAKDWLARKNRNREVTPEELVILKDLRDKGLLSKDQEEYLAELLSEGEAAENKATNPYAEHLGIDEDSYKKEGADIVPETHDGVVAIHDVAIDQRAVQESKENTSAPGKRTYGHRGKKPPLRSEDRESIRRPEVGP